MELPGRGRALRAIWSQSEAEVLAYMDVDLSTDLNALLPLVAPLLSGHSDLAIGTRLARGSRVVRGPKRELISRGYNLLLRTLLGARFSDAQCGFKAIRRDQARALLPLTQDTGWFFDTELLVLAERAGLRIHEIPVDWIDDLDSRVDIVATALADLRGMARLGVGLRARLHPGPAAARTGRRPRPAPAAGGPAAADRPVHGHRRGQHDRLRGCCSCCCRLAMPAQAANVLSLLVTAVANTAANRRLTFGISGRPDAARHQVKGLIAFGIGLALTSGALAVLHCGRARPAGRGLRCWSRPTWSPPCIRFLLYRHWVFGRPERRRTPGRPAAAPVDRTSTGTKWLPRESEPLERDHLRSRPRHATGRPAAGRARRLLRGPQADPRWARPALLGLLALTAVLYLWDLSRNGWANDFYAAAVQAGTKSWKAFFFGSFDAVQLHHRGQDARPRCG